MNGEGRCSEEDAPVQLREAFFSFIHWPISVMHAMDDAMCVCIADQENKWTAHAGLEYKTKKFSPEDEREPSGNFSMHSIPFASGLSEGWVF